MSIGQPRVFRLSQKAAKKGKHFLQGPAPFPPPNLWTTRPSCAQHLATACLFRLLGTNIKFKDGATQVPSRMFLYFSTSRFVAIILHDLRGNNLIQQSFVTFFVSFLTDVLRGSCFLPQQYSPARINVFARVLRTCYTYGRVVQYSQIDSISSTKSTNQSS